MNLSWALKKGWGSKFQSKEILFLTNNFDCIRLYDWILDEGFQAEIYSGKLHIAQIKEMSPKLIISYNYRYLISKDIIEYMNGRIINLHTSLLPWNRGASPNIWSFLEDTPKGVTIHLLDEGLDTGAIICQRELFFDPVEETFETSYQKLQIKMIELFKEHWKELYSGSYTLTPQSGRGSFHKKKNLEKLRIKVPFEYSDNIADVIEKYRSQYV